MKLHVVKIYVGRLTFYVDNSNIGIETFVFMEKNCVQR
jgi:hypothetical protein